MEYNNIKLTVELIPSTVFGSNVRSALTKPEWDKLRKECYAKANNKCEICGGCGLKQGYKHSQEAHEVWQYDHKTQIQKLIRLISLCPKCHQIKHIGRTFAIGKQAEALKHIELVNGWNHKQVVTYLAYAFAEHKIKSQIYWKLDISVLGIDRLKVSNAKKSRKGTKQFWRKKTTKKKQ